MQMSLPMSTNNYLEAVSQFGEQERSGTRAEGQMGQDLLA